MKTMAAIAGVGACTSIAPSALHTGFLLRAGCVGMMEAPLLDADEEPITACFLSTLDPLLIGAARASVLAAESTRAALATLKDALSESRLKLVLCVDEHFSRSSDPGVQKILSASTQAVQTVSQHVETELCSRGAAGPAFALPASLSALDVTCDAIVLTGVHTDYDPTIVARLDERGRLHKPDNLDSLIPGEASATVVLISSALAQRVGVQPSAKLCTLATGYEKATPDNDESAFEAIGLTGAVREAGAPVLGDQGQIGWVLTDITFELRRLYEWQAVSVRNRRLFCEPHCLDSPAQRLGHLGAAAMPLHFALATLAWHHQYAPSPMALSIAGSDGGDRAAAVLSAA